MNKKKKNFKNNNYLFVGFYFFASFCLFLQSGDILFYLLSSKGGYLKIYIYISVGVLVQLLPLLLLLLLLLLLPIITTRQKE